MKSIAIIPARMNSSRFPGKPLELIHGIPMLGHVYYRTRMASKVDLTCVATCDQEIFNYITDIGGFAIMTSQQHERASDRSAEALLEIERKSGRHFDVVAMIQGDEPMVQPTDIDMAIGTLVDDRTVNIVNLMGSVRDRDEFNNPNDVKVVVDLQGNALYFSREPIPSRKNDDTNIAANKQLGLIFFRHDYLLRFNMWKQTPLEMIESVDMMRVLENGEKIRMILSKGKNIGVDTKEDLFAAEKLMNDDHLMTCYLK